FGCACGPPSIMGTFAGLGHLVGTESAGGLQRHQFATGPWSAGSGEEAMAGSPVTGYPADRPVRITVEAAPGRTRRLSVRIPAWSRGTARVTFRGQPVELSQSAGYADIDAVFAAGDVIELELDMTPRFVGVHHRLDASRGAVALERGPL